jgi:acyl carrier protein
MDVENEVLKVLRSVLNVGGSGDFSLQTRLLGSVPELDSMAVVTILTSLEERFGIAFADDEVDGSSFASVGSLVALVRNKLEA